MSRKTIFCTLIVLAFAASGFAASSSSTPDLNTLKGKVAVLNGTAGLQIRFSAFIEEEAEFDGNQVLSNAPSTFGPSGAFVTPANIIVNQDTAGAPQNETAIVVDPNNPSRVVGGANDYVAGTWTCFLSGNVPCSAYGDGYSGTYYSNDGGQTWCCNSSSPSDIGTLVPGIEHLVGGQYDAGGDPALAFDGQGNVYYAGLGFNRNSAPNTVTVNKGTFDGSGKLTWGPPTFINQTNSPATVNDKEWIAVDSNPSSPFYGRVYVTWTRFLFNPAKASYVQSPIAMVYSSDGAKTFSSPQLIVGNVLYGQGSNVNVGPDGTVYVFWDGSTRLATLDSIYMVKSKDGGVTWSKPVAISLLQDLRVLPNTRFRQNSYPAGAVAPNGDLYVSWSGIVKDSDSTMCATRSYTNCHAAALYSKSTDGGATWSAPAPVLPDSDASMQTPLDFADPTTAPVRKVDTFWPRIAITPSGRVYMAAYAATTLKYVSSTSNTSLMDFRVRDLSTSTTQTVSANPLDTRYQFGGQFIGDYIGLAAASDESFHGFWNTNTWQTIDWWFGSEALQGQQTNSQDVVTASGNF